MFLRHQAYSMSIVAWDAGRGVRAELEHEFKVRVKVKCRCGRSLGFLYGDAERPIRHYWKGYIPAPILSNATWNFTCHPRCGENHSPGVDTLRAAYKKAAAAPHRLLVMPFDLKPVPRRQPAVRLDGAYIGGRRPVPAQHRAGPPTH
jgi:hypothetical protein